MKNKTLLFSILYLASIAANANIFNASSIYNQKFKLLCTLTGLPKDAKVYLLDEFKDTLETTTSRNGKFTFSGTLNNGGRIMYISFETSISFYPSKPIFVTPNEITIIGSVSSNEIDLLVKGANANNDLYDYYSKIESIQNSYATVASSLNSSKISEEEIKSLNTEVSILKDKFYSVAESWILNHKHSDIIPYLLYHLYPKLPTAKFQNLYSYISESQKNSFYGIKLEKEIKNGLVYKNFKAGQVFPNIQLLDTSNAEILLHTLSKEHKYTLLDFWASWCGPCRSMTPKLNEIVNLYKDKGFMIIGISIDESSNKWKKAINEDRTPWLHYTIKDLKNVLSSLGINRIPTYILLDQQSKIISFYCGNSNCLVESFGPPIHGDKLSNSLSKLLN